ncbi:MAG TPA: hypothetical protein VM686_28150 [Polyangiaceae bacterium]|nr:hypothetical protein [Polyangiaceae bacterium]
MAFDPTTSDQRLARLRRVRRVALVLGGLLSTLVVLGLRRCF